MFRNHHITPDSALGGTQIQRSLRFNHVDSSRIERTCSSSGNRQKWTWSAWVKRVRLGSTTYGLLSSDNGGDGGGNNGIASIYFGSDDKIHTYYDTTSGDNYGAINDAVYRDVTCWYHIVWQVDAANQTSKIWVNGVEQSIASGSQPIGGYNYTMNQSGYRMNIGIDAWDHETPASIYVAETHYSDGQLYDATDFGYTDAQTGQWRPKSGNVIKSNITYGTNGFWLDFRDNTSTTTLGYDYSGNGNHFTPDEVSVSGWEGNDSFIDTPTNNFPMLNIEAIYKVHNNTSDIYNGALKYNCHYDNQGSCPCSMAFPTSGKWYFEVKLLTSNSNATFGIVPALWSQDHNAVQETGARMYAAYGQYFVNGTNTSGVNGWGTSDTVAAALDMDEKKITFYKNNSVEITLALESGYENVPYLPILTGGTNGGSVNLGINFGANESWTYTPPAGFKSLCTNNLPPSASSPILKPQAHFDTVLWTGNGGTSQTVTGLEFQPDFVWVKGRSTAAWNRLQNSVVGANKLLYSNASNAEATDEANGYVSEFTSSGFQLADTGGNGGGVNASGETYAAWCWKAGGTAVSNSDGTIASQVSVNQDAGFSIVSYTGDGNATATIGHGLGKKPKWIITKCRSTATQADWVVWHEDLDDNKNVFLDKTNAQSTPSYGHITDPTSTLINVTKSSGNQTNASGQTYISYCWAEIPGYSKFSSYVGDGNNDGPFIHMGFSPAFLLLKCVGSSANWVLIDIKRNGYTSGGAPSEGNFENFKTLCPNLNNAENASGGTTNDVVSNGFKIRGGTDRNISGQKHIYAAFADFPDSTAYDTEPNAR